MFQKGDRVRVQGFGGRSAVLRVWEDRGKGLLLCSESSYEAALKGAELVAVGFPMADVKEKVA